MAFSAVILASLALAAVARRRAVDGSSPFELAGEISGSQHPDRDGHPVRGTRQPVSVRPSRKPDSPGQLPSRDDRVHEQA